MGPAHIITDRDKAFSELKREFQLKEEHTPIKEELLETVSIDGNMVRINFRPYKKKLDDVELLFSIMLESADKFVPDEDKLRSTWAKFKQMVSVGKFLFDIEDTRNFEINALSGDKTPIRHSEIYRENEKPRYRLALLSVIERWIPKSIM